MPDLFDVNTDQQASDLLPPDKRSPENLSLLRSFFKALQWCRDLVLGTYKTGATAPAYLDSSTYPIYSRVTFNKSMYEAIQDVPVTVDPTNGDYWLLVQKNLIGVDERIKYNGQNLVLTWALNHEFNGVFRQPVTGLNSDIYLVNIGPVLSGFRIGDDETGTVASPVSSIGSDTASASIGGNTPFVQVVNFTIMFEATLYGATNEKAVRNFVDKYIPVGIKYSITPY